MSIIDLTNLEVANFTVTEIKTIECDLYLHHYNRLNISSYFTYSITEWEEACAVALARI